MKKMEYLIDTEKIQLIKDANKGMYTLGFSDSNGHYIGETELDKEEMEIIKKAISRIKL